MARRRNEPTKTDLHRHRNHQHLSALGRNRRLLLRLERGRGLLRSGARTRRRTATRSGQTLEALRPVLENPKIAKIGQNLKYDMIVLRSAGVELAGLQFDTMVASYLLDAGERNHNLDELAGRYLNHVTTKIETLIGSGKNQKRMDEVPVSQITHYAAEDADVALRLVPPLAARLKESKLTKLLDDVEVPLIDVLVELESNGIKVDADAAGAS